MNKDNEIRDMTPMKRYRYLEQREKDFSKKGNSDNIIPTLMGFDVGDGVHIAVWCPYCKEFHHHGIGENGEVAGHRVAHCSRASNHPHSPLSDTGYFIREVPLPKSVIENIGKSQTLL